MSAPARARPKSRYPKPRLATTSSPPPPPPGVEQSTDASTRRAGASVSASAAGSAHGAETRQPGAGRNDAQGPFFPPHVPKQSFSAGASSSTAVHANHPASTRSSTAVEQGQQDRPTLRIPIRTEPVLLSPQEKRKLEPHAQLFTLIVLADRLEQAYMSGAAPTAEYEEKCNELITKFKNARRAYADVIPDIDQFAAEYRCGPEHGYQFGLHRLHVSAMPATSENSLPRSGDEKLQAKHVQACTQSFITLMDAFAMEQRAVETLLPFSRQLQITLGRVDGIGQGFLFLDQIREWADKMNTMPAWQDLTAEDVATIRLQTELGYRAFIDIIHNG